MTNSPPEPPALRLSVLTPRPGLVMVSASGEIDLDTHEPWTKALAGALSPPPPEILVADLAEVGFLSSTGINSLVKTHARAEAVGTRFRIVAADRPVRRPLELTGLHRTLTLCESRAAAFSEQPCAS